MLQATVTNTRALAGDRKSVKPVASCDDDGARRSTPPTASPTSSGATASATRCRSSSSACPKIALRPARRSWHISYYNISVIITDNILVISCAAFVGRAVFIYGSIGARHP